MAELVRVKEKFQITIPAALRKAAALKTGDYLEALQWGDGIHSVPILKPQDFLTLHAPGSPSAD